MGKFGVKWNFFENLNENIGPTGQISKFLEFSALVVQMIELLPLKLRIRVRSPHPPELRCMEGGGLGIKC